MRSRERVKACAIPVAVRNQTKHVRAEISERTIQSVLDYWFGANDEDKESVALHKKRWFAGDADQDREINAKFSNLVDAAAAGKLEAWQATPEGLLTLILLLDQFPRNLHRGTAAAFDYDEQALQITLSGLVTGVDKQLTLLQRGFFCMPLQHSESLQVQNRSVTVFDSLCAEPCPEHIANITAEFAGYARQHRDIVARFGRFPHRNKLLGRVHTEQETAFLEAGGPTFGQ